MTGQRRPRCSRPDFRICLALVLAAVYGNRATAGGGNDEPQQQSPDPPNIVFLLADDLGWTDLGCYGGRYYETPNLDRLASEGMRFTNAYTNGPNCAPTRACLLSGKYSPRHGVYTVNTGARGDEQFREMVPAENRTRLPAEEFTLAEALQAAGYATGCFGKWHLGSDALHGPMQQGFDIAAGRDGRPHPATDFLTKRAVDFIRRNAQRPFFCYLPYHAVHTPIRAPQSLTEKYRSKEPSEGHDDPVYAAMLEELDHAVGRVLKTLEELNLAEQTIVVFYSDNGGVGGYASTGIEGGREITHNAPLRGGKGMLYEGGIRVPLIVRWPKVVAAGTVCDQPVISVDFYPTFLDTAGTDRNSAHQLDGFSLMPLLRSATKESLARKALYWHFPGYLQARSDGSTWRTTPAGAVRSQQYKLIEFFETGRIELYNLEQDIGETRNLVEEMPDVAKLLHRSLIEWRKEVNAPMPLPKDQTSSVPAGPRARTSAPAPHAARTSGSPAAAPLQTGARRPAATR